MNIMTRTFRFFAVALLALAVFAMPSNLAGRQSQEISVMASEGTNIAVALSPDGSTLAMDLQGRIWLLPARGGSARPITDEFGDARQPTWSPDGSRVAFQSYRDGGWHIWSVAADGSDLSQHTYGPFDHREPHWSPDGNRIVFSSDRHDQYDIFELNLGTGAIARLTDDPASDFSPVYGPAGRLVAFVSERGEAPGVWLRAPSGGERLVASVESGTAYGPAFSPNGSNLSYVVIDRSGFKTELRLVDSEAEGQPGRLISMEGSDVFPFRAAWVDDRTLFYTSDGHIRRNGLSGGPGIEVPFYAGLSLNRSSYERRVPDFGDTQSQPVRGLLAPAVSPDGSKVAFTALGDLWLIGTDGENLERVTEDPFLDVHPAWSPDGSTLAFVSDRGGALNLWLRDIDTGAERQLTDLPFTTMSPAWSPDGSHIAFLAELGLGGDLRMVNVETGDVQILRDDLFAPGRPTWSPDGSTLALAALTRYSSRFREGRNEILLLSLEGEPDRRVTPAPHRSVGTRGGDGPVWSPDGRFMAYTLEGMLYTVAVTPDGTPNGPPRRLSNEIADWISWTGDSRSVLYQATDGFRLLSLDDGSVRNISVPLAWERSHPTSRLVVHAGALFDGRSSTLAQNVDVLVDGPRIVEVGPHDDANHLDREVVDASSKTVMPGLIEGHSHIGFGLGEALGRLWLSYGITTVRNPASDPFQLRERREATAAGVRIGPRELASGRMVDGPRVYYSGANALTPGAHVGLEIERADALDYDLLKTYVRFPDLMQRRVIEEAHALGLAVSSHELYPAAAVGADHMEHIRGTSRRGYSPKVSYLNASYDDVVQLLTASGMTITPTVGIMGGFLYAIAQDSTYLDDVRISTFLPEVVVQSLRNRSQSAAENPEAAWRRLAPFGDMVTRVVRGGGRVIAGTDSPIIPFAVSLHAELENYVDGGLTPAEALMSAMSVPAEALGLGGQLGVVAPHALADLVIVDGNPLENIRDARNVEIVVKHGRVYTLEELLERPSN